jgi:hypothetical protein
MRVLLLGVVVVGLSVGCSGDDDAVTTVPTSPSTLVQATLPPTAVVTVPIPTLPPTTTSTVPPPSVVTVPLTVPPLPSAPTLPPGDPATEIVAFLQEHFRLYNAAEEDPTSEAAVAAAAATMTGGALARFDKLIAGYRERGERALPLDQLPTRLDVDPSTVSVDGVTATVEACWLNSSLLIRPGAHPDGSDMIVDPSLSAVAQRYYLDASPGTWSVSDIETLFTYEGELTCAVP